MNRRETVKLDLIEVLDDIPDLAVTFDPIWGATHLPCQIPMEIYATLASYNLFIERVASTGLDTDMEIARCYGSFWRYELKLNIPEAWQPKSRQS
ncbi:MAG: hypothetical protein IT324_10240 [Anaerolineae bacterium]|nr:hypothetical protein [Anaerolineae bacterium]